jgi:thioredoxin-related protein
LTFFTPSANISHTANVLDIALSLFYLPFKQQDMYNQVTSGLRFLSAAVTLFLLPTLGLSQGVKFEETKWDAILQKAKTEKKLIFMDAYTTWCGPCKMMSRNVFPDAEAASYYNTHFVNVKMDMEKGEGIGLSTKYAVTAYPTLLFINSDGEVVHRALGYHGVPEFLALGKQAMDPNGTLAAMDKRYAKGDREADFVFKYMGAKADAMDPAYATIANDYLRSQGDFGTERNMDVIMRFVNDPFSDGFNYLLKNKEVFVKKFGADVVESKLQSSVGEYMENNKNLSLADIEKVFKKVFAADGERMFSGFKPNYFRQQGNKEDYAKASVAHFKKYPSKDPMELNEAAWTFYRVVEDKKMLKTAVKWAKKSVKLDNQYYNNDTLAALLVKSGKYKDAIKAGEKAIELAKKNNEDFSETEKLLEQARAGLKK